MSPGEVSAVSHTVAIMENMLRSVNRALSAQQWDYVKSKVEVEPTPLYAEFAVLVTSEWSSFAVPSDGAGSEYWLCGGVAYVVNQVFNRIELGFGKVLTRAVLAFITLSVNGISEDEMMDLLSLDDTVLDRYYTA